MQNVHKQEFSSSWIVIYKVYSYKLCYSEKAVGYTLYITIQLLLQFLFVYFLHHHPYFFTFNDYRAQQCTRLEHATYVHSVLGICALQSSSLSSAVL